MALGYATLVAFFSTIGAFLFGLDIGYIAPILVSASFKRDVGHLKNWNDPKSEIDSKTAGFIVGIFSIGCIFAAFPVCSAYFLDKWGRRSSITLGSAVFLVGCVLQAASASMAQFITGRFIAGLSIGLLSTVVSLYQSELAPAAHRGALTSLYQLGITFGILVACGLDYIFVRTDGGWRIAIALQAVPAIILIIGTSIMPRSPRWLVQQGRDAEALEVLQALRSSFDEAKSELDGIKDNHQAAQAQGEPRWAELCSGRLRSLLAVGMSIQLLQQFCGMNAFMYFGPIIFQKAGRDPFVYQTLMSVVNFLATFPALYVVDKYGRRCLAVWGGAGMMITCLMMGSVSLTQSAGLNKTDIAASSYTSSVVVAMCFCFVSIFATSWGPMAWVYCSEMFPLKHRSRCLGLTTTANWVGNYFIAQLTPVMLSTFGFSTFYVFAFFSWLCLSLGLWLPETKGLMLERVGELFDAKFGVLEDLGGKGGYGGKHDMAAATAGSYGAVGGQPC